jgi:hypothetical protein
MGGGRLSRARSAIASRSRKEKATGLAAVALVLTAPFGGLDRIAEEPPHTLTVGKPVTVGPYEVTFHAARRVREFQGEALEPWDAMPVKPTVASHQILVLDVDVVNAGKRPEYPLVLTKAVTIGGAVATGGYGGPTTRPELIYRADGSAAGELNPGLTHRLALVVEQPAKANSQQVTVSLAPLVYIGKGGGASNLDEDYWLNMDGVERRGSIPVVTP